MKSIILLFVELFLTASISFSVGTKQNSWKNVALNDLFMSGKITAGEELEPFKNVGNILSNWIIIERSDLGIILEKTEDDNLGKGLRLLSLVDKHTNTILSAKESIPIFSVELLDKMNGRIVTVHSEGGWQRIDYDKESELFMFMGADLPEGDKLCINLQTSSDPSGKNEEGKRGINWHWAARQGGDRYEFRKLKCPQISLRNLGPTMNVFYPNASGVVTEDPCGKSFRWSGNYPSGWTSSMQWTAIYDESQKTGLYVAMHDPDGSVKDMHITADSTGNSLLIQFEHFLALDATTTAAEHDGGVWRSFKGDWFDAVLIYRHWMRNFSNWYPKKNMGENGRLDTPQWFKELCVWAISSQSIEKMPETMRKFTDSLGITTALHWYNWHKIPFDNDYPHYFPEKEGFREAVEEIQRNGDCYLMPYINGRLWDMRDKGVNDFQFTSLALQATTKKENGKPYVEKYGSKEPDGSEVELAVMCPTTDVWKKKMEENISLLTNDCGVAGVYVDQVGAAKPVLCFDKSHGHPLAGGYWWNSEYWKMVEGIREKMPRETVLTTECNAETFVNVYDGFLTWHFQYQNQVPAFAAVYGGALQMFGISFQIESRHTLANRMKMAQQLVFGEQIGWIDPRIVDDRRQFPFFRKIVNTRYQFRDYFYKGEMIRPPKLLDNIPEITADWQWQGEQIISMGAVLSGAWRKTDEKGNTVSAVYFFVNVSDKPITSQVSVQFDEIGLKTTANPFEKPVIFEPGIPIAIELFSLN